MSLRESRSSKRTRTTSACNDSVEADLGGDVGGGGFVPGRPPLSRPKRARPRPPAPPPAVDHLPPTGPVSSALAPASAAAPARTRSRGQQRSRPPPQPPPPVPPPAAPPVPTSTDYPGRTGGAATSRVMTGNRSRQKGDSGRLGVGAIVSAAYGLPTSGGGGTGAPDRGGHGGGGVFKPPPSGRAHRGLPADPTGLAGMAPMSAPVPPSYMVPPLAPAAAEYALPRYDDADGHLVYKLGDGLYPQPGIPNGRYKILSELGEGTFGKVVECWDRRERLRVAVKVVRSVAKYRQAARLEIEMLQHVRAEDPSGSAHCVTLFSWFDYAGHICMVFEKLGPSLYEQLRLNRFRPFSLVQVRDFARQLLESVAFLHRLTLIHTDLKPENILLVSALPPPPVGGSGGACFVGDVSGYAYGAGAQAGVAGATDGYGRPHGGASGHGGGGGMPGAYAPGVGSDYGGRGAVAGAPGPVNDHHNTAQGDGYHLVSRLAAAENAIKLIDFGSATFQSGHHSAIISTRHYRAPEVILGLGWSYPCDLWSVGCILLELYTGAALFQTHDNLEHLAMMTAALGGIPQSMARRAERASSHPYFVRVRVDSAAVGRHGSSGGGGGSASIGDRERERPKGSARDRARDRDRDRDRDRGWERERERTRDRDRGREGDRDRGREGDRDRGRDRGRGGSPSVLSLLNWPAGATSLASERAVAAVRPLHAVVRPSGGGGGSGGLAPPSAHTTFRDLLHCLLTFEPSERITAVDALQHLFFGEPPHGVEPPLGSTSAAVRSVGDGGDEIPVDDAVWRGWAGRRDAFDAYHGASADRGGSSRADAKPLARTAAAADVGGAAAGGSRGRPRKRARTGGGGVGVSAAAAPSAAAIGAGSGTPARGSRTASAGVARNGVTKRAPSPPPPPPPPAAGSDRGVDTRRRPPRRGRRFAGPAADAGGRGPPSPARPPARGRRSAGAGGRGGSAGGSVPRAGGGAPGVDDVLSRLRPRPSTRPSRRG